MHAWGRAGGAGDAGACGCGCGVDVTSPLSPCCRTLYACRKPRWSTPTPQGRPGQRDGGGAAVPVPVVLPEGHGAVHVPQPGQEGGGLLPRHRAARRVQGAPTCHTPAACGYTVPAHQEHGRKRVACCSGAELGIFAATPNPWPKVLEAPHPLSSSTPRSCGARRAPRRPSWWPTTPRSRRCHCRHHRCRPAPTGPCCGPSPLWRTSWGCCCRTTTRCEWAQQVCHHVSLRAHCPTR